ncbi:uncharacterized protein LOC127711731 [Mytilus californianus]|uniref:uncharacterized protein LOC127711731 n=1 Tax=Mytilus californianus TaxID=6549 RepID=UPI002247275D|nr:uncharacterized protein LOC127711731 [Mytilus californianus]
MAAPIVESLSILTPFVENRCIICGFTFIQKETTSDGLVITNKFTHRKLKLTTERLREIEKVVGNLQKKKKDDNGVCLKCYRAVERVLRLEKEAEKTKAWLLKLIERVEQSSKQSDIERLPRNTSNKVEKNRPGSNKDCNDTCNEAIPFNELTNLARYVPIAAKPSTVNNCDQNVSKQADHTKTVGPSLGFEQADNTETVSRSLGLEQADNTETVGRSLKQADNIETVGRSLGLEQANNIESVGRSLGLEHADNTETVGCSLELEQADNIETVGCSLGLRSGTDDNKEGESETFVPKSRKRKREVDSSTNNTCTNRNIDKKVKSVPAKNLTNQGSNQVVTCSQDTVDDDDSYPTMYLVKTGLPKDVHADEVKKTNNELYRNTIDHNYSKKHLLLPWVQGKQFICPYCCTDKTGRSFDTESELNLHKNTHTRTMPQICQSCWKCFGTREELFKHNFMEHNDLYRKQIEAQKNKYYRKIIPVQDEICLQTIIPLNKFKESQTQNEIQEYSGNHETIETHINEELGSSTINPSNQDSVHLNERSPTHLEAVDPYVDNDSIENHIKVEPGSPTTYNLTKDAVHINEGQLRPIQGFSYKYNTIEPQVEEKSGLLSIHPLNQDAVHNHEGFETDKLSFDHKSIEPQLPTSPHLHENGEHNNDGLKNHLDMLEMQKLSCNYNSMEYCINKEPESYINYPLKLVAVHTNDKLQTELETEVLNCHYDRIETQIKEEPGVRTVYLLKKDAVHDNKGLETQVETRKKSELNTVYPVELVAVHGSRAIHSLKQDAVHNNEGLETQVETQKKSELNTVYPVELVAVHTNGGLRTVHPVKQDAVHMDEGFQTQLETQKVSSDHDTIEVHIKEEPAWPDVHVMNQNEVHINEGLQKHQETQNPSCVSNTKESVTMEDTGLFTMHPLEQDAEAIPEASRIQAQVSATIFEQLQKEPLISHMDCLSQTEGSNHGNLHICSVCNREFSCLKDLQWHLCKKTYPCEICNAEFIADFLLQKHMEKHSNQTFFLCGICKAPFDSKVERGKHTNVMHRKKFQCIKCSKDFPNKYSRKRHNLIHTGQIFFCKLCDYSFATKHSLERHINAAKHSALAKKTFVCEICHESFLRKTNLVKHIAIHKKTKSFTCLTCSKTYDCKYDLSEHYKLCKKDAFQESSKCCI